MDKGDILTEGEFTKKVVEGIKGKPKKAEFIKEGHKPEIKIKK